MGQNRQRVTPVSLGVKPVSQGSNRSVNGSIRQRVKPVSQGVQPVSQKGSNRSVKGSNHGLLLICIACLVQRVSCLCDDDEARRDIPRSAVTVLVVTVQLAARHVAHIQSRRSCRVIMCGYTKKHLIQTDDNGNAMLQSFRSELFKKKNRLKITSYRRWGKRKKKVVFLLIFVHAAARGGTRAFTSKIVNTLIKNSSRDDRPSIST